ncbi:hypothetical protein CesoFtcFv8_003589 [Champsocephalus esox]|uniref:Uncharacterized protein n=2 Tax=Champsocephalus TaxID=52236 RepID=A0AAN8E022_CHAGU|nr:hypothetical protein CesoFtcFv8_003589 [Champsocephalus esox]KAK5932281.1 hypothetical protein CgunFtcFv8_004000 [Champsocephalus gunnari]
MSDRLINESLCLGRDRETSNRSAAAQCGTALTAVYTLTPESQMQRFGQIIQKCRLCSRSTGRHQAFLYFYFCQCDRYSIFSDTDSEFTTAVHSSHSSSKAALLHTSLL